jgi:hypothetical protein
MKMKVFKPLNVYLQKYLVKKMIRKLIQDTFLLLDVRPFTYTSCRVRAGKGAKSTFVFPEPKLHKMTRFSKISYTYFYMF